MSDFDKNEVIELSSDDYKKESTNMNLGNIVPLIIPLAVVYSSSKSKNNPLKDILSDSLPIKNEAEFIEKSEVLVGKLSNALDVMKKVNKINDIRKVSANGNGSVENIHETFSVIKELFADSTHIDRINSLESTVTTIKKFADVKKILDSTASLEGALRSPSKQLLQGEASNDKGMNGLEKIVKMASIFSALTKET